MYTMKVILYLYKTWELGTFLIVHKSADFYHHRLFHDVDITCIESCVLTVN